MNSKYADIVLENIWMLNVKSVPTLYQNNNNCSHVTTIMLLKNI